MRNELEVMIGNSDDKMNQCCKKIDVLSFNDDVISKNAKKLEITLSNLDEKVKNHYLQAQQQTKGI